MLSIDEANCIVWGDHVAKQWVSDHRWHTTYLVVYKQDNALMGFYYLEPATEMQEGGDVYELVDGCVPVFPVTAWEVVKIIYEEVRDPNG